MTAIHEDAYEPADWHDEEEEIRERVLYGISRSVSPSEMREGSVEPLPVMCARCGYGHPVTEACACRSYGCGGTEDADFYCSRCGRVSGKAA